MCQCEFGPNKVKDKATLDGFPASRNAPASLLCLLCYQKIPQLFMLNGSNHTISSQTSLWIAWLGCYLKRDKYAKMKSVNSALLTKPLTDGRDELQCGISSQAASFLPLLCCKSPNNDHLILTDVNCHWAQCCNGWNMAFFCHYK